MTSNEKREERKKREIKNGIVLRVKWREKRSGVTGDDGERDRKKKEFEEKKGNREKKKEDDGAE